MYLTVRTAEIMDIRWKCERSLVAQQPRQSGALMKRVRIIVAAGLDTLRTLTVSALCDFVWDNPAPLQIALFSREVSVPRKTATLKVLSDMYQKPISEIPMFLWNVFSIAKSNLRP